MTSTPTKTDLSTTALLWQGWPAGIDPALTEAKLLPGALVFVLDCQPTAPLAALHYAEYQVLAVNSDPFALLSTEAGLISVERSQLLDWFRQLGNSLKNGLPLDRWLPALYQTHCPGCQNALNADYFVWDRDASDPHQKYLTCPTCGFAGLTPITPADLDRLDQIETRGIHYQYLLNRTIAISSPDKRLRLGLEQMQELYTPRALYVIAEIIMKIEALFPGKTAQLLFKGILAKCLLFAGSLFDRLEPTRLPKRLRPPRRYLERNVWQLFERAVKTWPLPSRPIRIAPHLTDFQRWRQNSIHFFADHPGHLRRYLTDESISLVIAALPRPEPVRWALSTLWSGWLLGPKAAEANYPYLSQKWPDWRWYRRRLLADLKPFQSALKPDGQIRLLLTAAHPVQPAVIVIAALQAGFEPEIWQIVDQDHTFTLSPIPPDKPPAVELATLAALVRQEAYDAAQGQLAQADQPPTETVLIWTCWQSLLYSGLLHQVMTSMPVDQILNWTTDQIQAALTAIRG